MIAYAKFDQFQILGYLFKWTFRCYFHLVKYTTSTMPLIPTQIVFTQACLMTRLIGIFQVTSEEEVEGDREASTTTTDSRDLAEEEEEEAEGRETYQYSVQNRFH